MQVNIQPPKTKKDFNDYYYLRWFVLRKDFEDNLESSKDELEGNSFHVMALYKGEVIGVGRIHKIDNQSSQIRYMAIDCNYRGFGIGNLILLKLIKNAKLYRLKGDINTISPNLVYSGIKNFLNSK